MLTRAGQVPLVTVVTKGVKLRSLAIGSTDLQKTTYAIVGIFVDDSKMAEVVGMAKLLTHVAVFESDGTYLREMAIATVVAQVRHLSMIGGVQEY